MAEKAYLHLENGAVFEGEAFGAQHEVLGEVVFATGMTGYLETLTDKSYYGQIVVQTFPLIGNYGVIPADFEGEKVTPRGYIVKNWCQEPSNFRSEGDLDAFLKGEGVSGLYGIDTRALTKMIREHGVMNGKITYGSDRPPKDEIAGYRIRGAVAGVSQKEERYFAPSNPRFRVALMDYGYKENILRELLGRGCEVWVLPHHTPKERLAALGVQGVMLSNGPGDPTENRREIEMLRQLCEMKIPLFGICLGHQLLALAHGFKTEKLKYGHRGANQPAKDKTTGRVYITSQNHGYAVTSQSIAPQLAQEWFVNVNDNTCEGILYQNAPALSVQFHPEACGGPLDTGFLFDRFIQMMEVK